MNNQVREILLRKALVLLEDIELFNPAVTQLCEEIEKELRVDDSDPQAAIDEAMRNDIDWFPKTRKDHRLPDGG